MSECGLYGVDASAPGAPVATPEYLIARFSIPKARRESCYHALYMGVLVILISVSAHESFADLQPLDMESTPTTV